jgi:hypothetical protein
LKRLKSSEPLYKNSADGLYGHKSQSFPPNWASKLPESQQLFFGGWLVRRIFEEFQHPVIQIKIAARSPLAIFSSKKMRQPK